MGLLDTVNTIETTARERVLARRRRQQRANERRQSQRGVPLPSTSEAPFGYTSFHDSRYAGNAQDQGRGYPMPPPVGVGYDMQEVMARMHENFKQNQKRYQEMRDRQVRMFQAAMKPPEESQPPQEEQPGPQPQPTQPTQPAQPPSDNQNPYVAPPVQQPIGGQPLPITGINAPNQYNEYMQRVQQPQQPLIGEFNVR